MVTMRPIDRADGPPTYSSLASGEASIARDGPTIHVARQEEDPARSDDQRPQSTSHEQSDTSLMSRHQALKDDRPLLYASLQVGVLFVGSSVVALILLRLLLPSIDPEDAPNLKIPKSFDDLKTLNDVVQSYRQDHLGKVVASFVIIYLFLQAFSLPGSMYLSILGGSIFNLWALPLVCICIACGATLCYTLSSIMGPPILANSSKWRNRVSGWRKRIQAQQKSLLSYLIVLRIAPLPPHWVVNMVAPHLGIQPGMFWLSTFLGVIGTSYIHVSIGTALDSMTSSDDFHLISVKNAIGLGGIVLAALAPVIIRHAWKEELADAASESAVGTIALPLEEDDSTLRFPKTLGDSVKSRDSELIFLDSQDRPLAPRSRYDSSANQRAEMQRARQLYLRMDDVSLDGSVKPR